MKHQLTQKNMMEMKSEDHIEETKSPKIGKFTRKELLHLNKKPKMDYLKRAKSNQDDRPRWNAFRKKQTVPIVFRREERPVKEFTEQDFKAMVQSAKITRIESSSRKKVYNRISHMSQMRTEPLSQLKPEEIIDTLKRSITVIEFKYNEYKASC